LQCGQKATFISKKYSSANLSFVRKPLAMGIFPKSINGSM